MNDDHEAYRDQVLFEFSGRLRQLRGHFGLSQEQLAQRAGGPVTRHTICNIERGHNATIVTLRRICDGLGITPAQFYSGAGPQPARSSCDDAGHERYPLRGGGRP